MAMQLGGGGDIKADINVTPLVDVMLVLLIIVMLVAPLVQQGVSLTLPIARNTSDHPETSDQTTVAITSDKRFFVNGNEVEEKGLRDRFEMVLEGKKEKLILIKADVEADYGDVMKAMDELRAVGIEDMALITDAGRRPGTAGGE
ncbi:MAG: biopolymer transporter ExbD [Acidobacteria bacterium]|nr:biopolymer transporter ExbD [Acidobacteriota bacterium]